MTPTQSSVFLAAQHSTGAYFLKDCIAIHSGQADVQYLYSDLTDPENCHKALANCGPSCISTASLLSTFGAAAHRATKSSRKVQHTSVALSSLGQLQLGRRKPDEAAL